MTKEKYQVRREIIIEKDVQFESYNNYVGAMRHKVGQWVQENYGGVLSIEQLNEVQFRAETESATCLFTIKFE